MSRYPLSEASNYTHKGIESLRLKAARKLYSTKGATTAADVLAALADRSKRKRSIAQALSLTDKLHQAQPIYWKNTFQNLIGGFGYGHDSGPGHLRLNMKVPLHLIKSGQDTVGAKELKAKIRGTFAQEFHPDNPDTPIVTVGADESLRVVDGNHRVNKAVLMREPYIIAHVFWHKNVIPAHLKKDMPINVSKDETLWDAARRYSDEGKLDPIKESLTLQQLKAILEEEGSMPINSASSAIAGLGHSPSDPPVRTGSPRPVVQKRKPPQQEGVLNGGRIR